MNSIIFLFTNGIVKVFFIIFKIPFITKMLTHRWDNKSNDLTPPGSYFTVIWFFGGQGAGISTGPATCFAEPCAK